MTKLSENRYYEVIQQPLSIVVLGEPDEQWTELLLTGLRNSGLPFTLITWAEVPSVRLQFEYRYYPVLQVWRAGEMLYDLVGYQSAPLSRILKKLIREGSHGGKERKISGPGSVDGATPRRK